MEKESKEKSHTSRRLQFTKHPSPRRLLLLPPPPRRLLRPRHCTFFFYSGSSLYDLNGHDLYLSPNPTVILPSSFSFASSSSSSPLHVLLLLRFLSLWSQWTGSLSVSESDGTPPLVFFFFVVFFVLVSPRSSFTQVPLFLISMDRSPSVSESDGNHPLVFFLLLRLHRLSLVHVLPLLRFLSFWFQWAGSPSVSQSDGNPPLVVLFVLASWLSSFTQVPLFIISTARIFFDCIPIWRFHFRHASSLALAPSVCSKLQVSR